MYNLNAYKRALGAVQHIGDSDPPWAEVLSSAQALIGADAATLLMLGTNQELLFMQQEGVDAAAEREYRQYYHRLDALAAEALAGSVGHWLDSSEISKDPAKRVLPFYADYLPRHRMNQVLAYVIIGDQDRRAAISFQRTKALPGVTRRYSEGPIASYMKSLVAAVAEREAAGRVRLETIEETLSSLNEAALLAYPTGEVFKCSTTARAILRKAKILDVTCRFLTHPRPEVAKQVHHALRRSEAGKGAVKLAIPISWGEGLCLDVMPAPAALRLATEPILFVRAKLLTAFDIPELHDVATYFKLTAAEARVFLGLVAGHSPADLARSAGVAERTVRNQLASLMRKTCCNRQSELVRLGSKLF